MNLNDLFDTISNKIQSHENLKDLEPLLANYTNSDWKNYCTYCNNKYKRNLVRKDDYIEMLVICWEKGQQSGIHDHPESGCLMKLLDGNIQENVYECVDGKIKCIESNTLVKSDIAYKQGKQGLHDIINSDIEKSVSLHIYSPPNYKFVFY